MAKAAGGGGKDGLEMRTLQKRHAFGIKTDVYGCLSWVDENTLTFPVGRNVVTHNVQTNTQKFFLTSEKTEAITAIALTPSKKYIAIAESGEHPQIQIVETASRRRRRVLNVTDLQSDSFVAMEFSSDGRHLVTQGGAPQWNLLYWNWERSKPLAQTAVAREHTAAAAGHTAAGGREGANLVTKVSINPRDPLHVVVSGAGLFRSYRYLDGMLKVVPGGLGKTQPQNFTCHAWVTEERIVVATDNADLLLIENGDYRCSLPAAPADGHAILAIEPTSKGFVCGADTGLIHIFEQSDDKELYRKLRTVTIEPKIKEIGEDVVRRCGIKAFALKHGEDTLALVTTTQQIFAVNFNVDWTKTETPVFASIVQPFHSGPIVGLDACVRKPLVATSSTEDRTVRIWNTHEQTVDVIKHFTSDPGAVALHPSGLHILVCFPERVRLMNVYGDNLADFKSLVVRSVSDIKFSIGGQYFALVHGNVIHVYNTYTVESAPIGQLRGHAQKVKSLQWASTTHYPTDNRLVSCSLDGVVIDWDLGEFRKVNDHIDKRFQYQAIASDDKNIWVVGTASSSQQDAKWRVKLREMEISNLHGDTVANDYDFPDLQLTTLALASQHRLLFGGCHDGSVKLMTFPLQGGIHDPPILAHSGAVSRIVVSFDENMLYTVGLDGSFYIFDIREDGRTAKRETAFAEEILISKQDLEEKTSTTAALRSAVDDLNLDMDYKEKRRGVQHDERVKELTQTFSEESERQTLQFTSVWNAKSEQEQVYAKRKSEKLEEHTRDCAKLEAEKQVKLQKLEEQSKLSRATLDENRQAFKVALKDKEEEYERARREAMERFQERLEIEEDLLKKLTTQITRSANTHTEVRAQLETDTDAEIENVKRKYEEALHKERDKYLHMKGENAIMRKNMTALTKEIENRAAEVRALDVTKQQLNGRIQALLGQIHQFNLQLEERDGMIADKEKRIYELKKKNQDLEKHKFVLDHRIRQLKAQIEPRQREIAIEKEKIKAKDAALSQLHRNNLGLRANIDTLKEQIRHHQGEIRTLLNKLKDFDTYKLRVKTDIGELAQKVQDPDELRLGVEKMYYDHVTSRGGKRQPPLEADLRHEFAAHTDFLGRTVDALKRKVTDDHEAHKQEIADVMLDNLSLIKEIHDLRRDIRLLRTNMQSADAGAAAGGAGGTASAALVPAPPVDTTGRSAAVLREMEQNKHDIKNLKDKIVELEKALQARTAVRPGSRDRFLPPVSA